MILIRLYLLSVLQMDNLFTEVKEKKKNFYTIYHIKFNVKGE